MASYKSVGFGDERRTLADSIKPRGRNDRLERDRILGWRVPAPTEVREGENSRDSRDERSSRDTTKETNLNRNALKVNTDVPAAPQAQISPPKDLPSGGRPSTVQTSGATSSRTATPARPCPKSSDPALQGTFEALYRSSELLSKRTLLSWEREKKKKEMEARRIESNNTPSNSTSLREAQRIQKMRDEEELKVLTDRYWNIDKDHRGFLEGIAAIVQRAQPSASGLPAAPPTTDPTVADLAAKFADLEKQHRQAQNEIQKLQTARPPWTDLEKKLSQAQEAIVELQTSREKSIEEHEKTTEVCRALMSKQNELEKDMSTLAEENAQLKKKVTALHEDFVEMRNAMSSKASNVDLEEAKASARNVQDITSRVDTSLAAVESRTSTVESQLSTILEHTENLDFNTLDDMGDKWMTHNIGESVPIMKQRLDHLERDLAQIQQTPNQQQKLLQKNRQDIDRLSKSIQEQGLRLVQEPTPPVPDDDWKKQISELQQKSQMIAQLQEAVASTGQQIMRIQENLQKLHRYTEDSMSKQAVLFGEMIDEVSGRVTELEGARRGFVTMIDDMTPRVTKLEIMAKKPNASCEDVKTKLTTVEQKLAALSDMEAQASAQRDVQLLTQKIQTVELHLDDGDKRLDAVTLGIEALNTQLSHITTRHLFDLIVRHVDQNHHRHGTRISDLESKLASTQDAVDRANESLQRLREVHAPRRLDTKRSASPATQTADANVKRMRITS